MTGAGKEKEKLKADQLRAAILLVLGFAAACALVGALLAKDAGEALVTVPFMVVVGGGLCALGVWLAYKTEGPS